MSYKIRYIEPVGGTWFVSGGEFDSQEAALAYAATSLLDFDRVTAEVFGDDGTVWFRLSVPMTGPTRLEVAAARLLDSVDRFAAREDPPLFLASDREFLRSALAPCNPNPTKGGRS